MDTTERVERFLRNQMTEEEENDFREELSMNTELRDEATMMALLIRGTIDMGKEEDASLIRAARKTAKDEVLSITRRKPGKWKQIHAWMPTILSAAAVFIVAFAINRGNTDHITTTLPEQNLSVYAQDIAIDYVPSKGITDGITEERLARLIKNVEENVFMASSIVQLEDYYQTAIGNIASREEYTRDFLEDNRYIIGMTLTKAYLMTDNKEGATCILDDLIKKYPKDREIQKLRTKLNPR